MTIDQVHYDLRIWFIAQLKMLTEKVMQEEQKRQDKIRRQMLNRLGDYQTYNDLQDAYGCGVITEKQFDRLADILEKSNPEPSELYTAKIELLTELYQEQKKLLDDLTDFMKRNGEL